MFGLVLAFVSAMPTTVLPFAVVAAALLLATRARLDVLLERARAALTRNNVM